MNKFVWLKDNGQIDIWRILDVEGDRLRLQHTSLKTEKWMHEASTRNHFVWYEKHGRWKRGFVYERRGSRLLIEIPINGLGVETWIEAIKTLPVDEFDADRQVEALGIYQ